MGQDRKPLTKKDIDEYMKAIARNTKNEALLKLVRSDLEAGLLIDDVEMYANRKDISYLQMEKISAALKKGDEGRKLTKACLAAGGDIGRLSAAMEFWEKGLPFDKVLDGVRACKTPHDLNALYTRTFERIASKNAEKQEVRAATEEAVKPDKEAGVLEVADKPGEAKTGGAEENARTELESLRNRVRDLEADNERLLKKSEDSETLLSEQQNQITQGLKAVAEYRNRIDLLQAENKKLSGEILGLSAQAEKMREQETEGQASEEETEKSLEKPEMKRKGDMIRENGNMTGSQADKKTSEKAFSNYEEGRAQIPFKPPEGMEQITISAEDNPIPVYYAIFYRGHTGKVQASQIEQTKRKEGGLLSILAGFGFQKKSRQDIMRMSADGRFTPEQLEQIHRGMVAGLTEPQMKLLVNPALSTLQMQGLIRIGECQNRLNREGSR